MRFFLFSSSPFSSPSIHPLSLWTKFRDFSSLPPRLLFFECSARASTYTRQRELRKEREEIFNIFNKCVSLSIFSKWNGNPQKPPKGKQTHQKSRAELKWTTHHEKREKWVDFRVVLCCLFEQNMRRRKESLFSGFLLFCAVMLCALRGTLALLPISCRTKNVFCWGWRECESTARVSESWLGSKDWKNHSHDKLISHKCVLCCCCWWNV